MKRQIFSPAAVFIVFGSCLFLLVLFVSAYFEPDIRWLHFFQAWMYFVAIALSLRRSRWGLFHRPIRGRLLGLHQPVRYYILPQRPPLDLGLDQHRPSRPRRSNYRCARVDRKLPRNRWFILGILATAGQAPERFRSSSARIHRDNCIFRGFHRDLPAEVFALVSCDIAPASPLVSEPLRRTSPWGLRRPRRECRWRHDATIYHAMERTADRYMTRLKEELRIMKQAKRAVAHLVLVRPLHSHDQS